MKILKRWLFAGIILLLVQGCKKPGCFEEAGEMVKVTRSASPFSKIELHDNINLVLRQDTVESIIVEAGQHMIPNISTDIADGKLTIRNNSSCQWLRLPSVNITVYASVKELSEVIYSASGNITSTNTLVTDHITFTSDEGAGNVEVSLDAGYTGAYIHKENADFIFKGKSDVCFSYINARGSIDFKDFAVKNMHIEYGGVRNATINVLEDLNAIIYHTGNLYYKGKPNISQNTTHSTGRLLQIP